MGRRRPAAARAARLLAEADGRPRSRSTHARPTPTAVSRRCGAGAGKRFSRWRQTKRPRRCDEAPQRPTTSPSCVNRDREGVEVFDSVFTVVVDAAPHVVRLKPFAGINGDPYFDMQLWIANRFGGTLAAGGATCTRRATRSSSARSNGRGSIA